METNLSFRHNPFQPGNLYLTDSNTSSATNDAVMDVRRMDSHLHEQPKSANLDMFLSTLYLFVSVYTTLNANITGGYYLRMLMIL